MFIACEFCGALFDATVQRWFDAARLGEMFARSWPSAASERFHTLGAALEQLPSDGPVYRALAQEYHYIYALLYPDRVPAPPTAKARIAWASRAACTAAAMRFDPVVAPLFAEARETYRAFGKRTATATDMVAAARAAVDATTRAYAALKCVPELASDYRLDAAHYARIDVRLSFATMAGTFEDPAAYTRVATEVFGDRDRAGDACARCGAPLDDDGETPACAHCGAVIERFADDPWVRAKLAVIALAHREPSLDADTYLAALAVFSAVGSFEQAGAARVAELIARAIPWLSAAELHRAATLYRDMIPTAARAIFDAAMASLEPWTPDPTRRPALSVPPTTFDEAAWLARAQRTFGYTAGTVLDAFGIAISDLLASPAAPITVELVRRFFELVLPGVSRSRWHAELAPLVQGYADTPAGPLVRATRDGAGGMTSAG